MIEIPLRARDGSVRAYAMIDDEDAHLAESRWHLSPQGYARRNVWDRTGERPICRTIFLHREVLGLARDDPRQGDHRNRVPLDCRRENLRPATRKEQGQNHPPRRRIRGAYQRGNGRWQALVVRDGEPICLGTFASEPEAGAAVLGWRLANYPFAID